MDRQSEQNDYDSSEVLNARSCYSEFEVHRIIYSPPRFAKLLTAKLYYLTIFERLFVNKLLQNNFSCP